MDNKQEKAMKGIMILAMLMLATSAAATYDKKTSPTNVTNVQTSVSTNVDAPTNVTGDKMRAISVSGADMEIGDCMTTESVLFGAWQFAKPNRMCLADKAQAAGRFQDAANLRCSYMSVRKTYPRPRKENCVAALTFQYASRQTSDEQKTIEQLQRTITLLEEQNAAAQKQCAESTYRAHEACVTK